MTPSPPNVLLIMTDEERYPPPYEDDAVTRYRRDYLSGRERLRSAGMEFHRHYAASTACVPSRASLFTGHYPSLHGVRSTDGLAKSAADPAMSWLDPDLVPTLGDWFRSAGYRTHYRGKWHISHSDLVAPGSHVALAANNRDGTVFDDVVDLYRRTNRLDPFGFSGWIGREPHGPDPADTGFVRDDLFGDQVCQLFADLEGAGDDTPWLAVASFVNPHDIAFSGLGWQLLGFPEVDSSVPDVSEAPSQKDSFDGRPACQEQFRHLWPQLLYPQPADNDYRRFYLWLHALADRAISRVVDTLEASRFADNTVVVFTSDHGDMVGAHGGMQQKWYNAFDESIRVPFSVSGPGITPGHAGADVITSHVDILPTLLGLIGCEPEALLPIVGEHHIEAVAPVGRDLSGLLLGGRDGQNAADDSSAAYFMTEDEISRGLRLRNRFTGDPFTPVSSPAKVESVIASLPSGRDGSLEVWKLNRYYDHFDGDAVEVVPAMPVEVVDPVEDQWELHNLTVDPEERSNQANAGSPTLDALLRVLERERRAKRLVPRRINRANR